MSPNNDGYNDFIILDYDLPKTNYILNVYILDSWGRFRGKLLENHTLEQKSALVFVPPSSLREGIYVLVLSLVNIEGRVESWRLGVRVE